MNQIEIFPAADPPMDLVDLSIGMTDGSTKHKKRSPVIHARLLKLTSRTTKN